jgi:hypothetical protein
VELANEARYLHRAFFRKDPPAEVVDRYIAANTLCFPESSPLASKMMSKIVAARLDAEAVELALRLHKGPTILTRKIQILFYLLEVRSEYYSFFVGERESRLRAILGMSFSVFQTAVKSLKGVYLVRRHGLV